MIELWQDDEMLILTTVESYLNKHEAAVNNKLGSEYVYQNKSVQEDAIAVFAEIFDWLSRE